MDNVVYLPVNRAVEDHEVDRISRILTHVLTKVNYATPIAINQSLK